MQRFKNILFYADGQTKPSPALARAMRLAESNHARLTLVDVIEPIETPSEVKDHFAVELDDLLGEQRQKELDELIQPYLQDDSLIYTRVLSGIAFIEIIRLVQSSGYDLVIKQARPPSGIGERLLGSLDLHLLRKCPCPVLIDHPNVASRYRRVLATLDTNAPDAGGCDSLVLPLAHSLAQRENAQLDLVHAWQLPGESMFRSGRFRLPSMELNNMLQHREDTQRARLAELMREHDLAIDEARIHLIKGPAAASINEVAKSLPADIIVMGTVGRVGVPGLFIGNTAEEVLQNAASSILAVKPAGFESPVK